MTEMHSSKLIRGNLRPATRHLASCLSCAARRSAQPLPKESTMSCVPQSPAFTMPKRTFFHLVAPISSRRMEFSECRTLKYTPEQMYNVVANVDQYQHFVPWCNKSQTVKCRNGKVQARLEIGFSPLCECYISDVTTVPNYQVRAVSTDGSLFNHLEARWRFSPGAKNQPDSCKVEVYVLFEFKSPLHSQLTSVFFDDVVKQMIAAFESQAAKLYGTGIELHRKPRRKPTRSKSL